MPAYGLDKIKFATDAPTWGRALTLYENGKITNFKSDKVGYSATVHGGHQYHVFVSGRCHADQDGAHRGMRERKPRSGFGQARRKPLLDKRH
jgi:hypothetical protein